jgi:hypothetical protein
LGAELVPSQDGAQQTAVSFFDRDALGGGATAELFYHKGFDVTDEELRHGKKMLSVIAVVKAGSLFSLSRKIGAMAEKDEMGKRKNRHRFLSFNPDRIRAIRG